MKNVRLERLLRRLFVRPPKRGIPTSRAERAAVAARARWEAFDMEITDEQRAADRQLLQDAKSGKGSLI